MDEDRQKELLDKRRQKIQKLTLVLFIVLGVSTMASVALRSTPTTEILYVLYDGFVLVAIFVAIFLFAKERRNHSESKNARENLGKFRIPKSAVMGGLAVALLEIIVLYSYRRDPLSFLVLIVGFFYASAVAYFLIKRGKQRLATTH